jgi:hypothetical protein
MLATAPPLTAQGTDFGPQKVLSSEDYGGVFRSPTATNDKDEPAGQALF